MRMGFILFSLMCICSVSYGGESALLVGNFSGSSDGIIPEEWQPLQFDGVKNSTIYSCIVDDSRTVVWARSEFGASGLVRKIVIDPNLHSTVSFRWKVAGAIPSADLSTKNGDDASARIYITFAYDSSKVSFWERVKFETIKLFYGEYPPIGALTYVWANRTPKNTILDSPYTNRVKIIVLQSGDERKEMWFSEQRNIQADYQKAFGVKEVPLISGVAIMTDTDNTMSKAVAWYGDIVFSR